MSPEAEKNWDEKMSVPAPNRPIPPEVLERLKKKGIEFRKHYTPSLERSSRNGVSFNGILRNKL